MSTLKQTLIEAARAGADRMQYYFHKEHDITQKEGVNNPVTEADKASEQAIFSVIRKNFPDHFLLSEEAGELVQESAYKWIIDPIDGTINYAQGIPVCAVSIGLEKEGKLILGAVYNPFMEEFFLAEAGKGATLNDNPIHVSRQQNLDKSCLATGFPYSFIAEPNGPLEVFNRFIRRGLAMRRIGSAALDLCWTACGRYDGFYEHDLHPWDTSAGVLILQEAGGQTSNFAGEDYDIYKPGIIASNGLLHGQLLDIIQPKTSK